MVRGASGHVGLHPFSEYFLVTGVKPANCHCLPMLTVFPTDNFAPFFGAMNGWHEVDFH